MYTHTFPYPKIAFLNSPDFCSFRVAIITFQPIWGGYGFVTLKSLLWVRFRMCARVRFRMLLFPFWLSESALHLILFSFFKDRSWSP